MKGSADDNFELDENGRKFSKRVENTVGKRRNVFVLCISIRLTLSQTMKGSADDNFELDENGRKFSKRVENTVGKRRNCSLRAISPFPAVFSKDLYCRHVKTRACL